MDYATFYPQHYQTLTTENLQAVNNAFQVNGSNQHPLPQQEQQPSNVAQLPQNMFFLDPFDTKGPEGSNDQDHASYSSKSLISSDKR
jgi:hypothetical protein